VARIQTPQHVQELQAQFKIREQFGLELLETVQPTFSLGDLKVASTGYPRKCMGRLAISAGGVGTNVEGALTCPQDLGIVVLFDAVWIQTGATGYVAELRITDGVAMATISSTPAEKAFRDGRVVAQLPAGRTDIANPLTAAPNGKIIGRIEAIADENTIIPIDVILGGGAYFLIRNVTANLAMNLTFLWTEFLLEDR